MFLFNRYASSRVTVVFPSKYCRGWCSNLQKIHIKAPLLSSVLPLLYIHSKLDYQRVTLGRMNSFIKTPGTNENVLKSSWILTVMPKVNISCGEGESPHIIKDGMIDNGGRYEWIHKRRTATHRQRYLIT